MIEIKPSHKGVFTEFAKANGMTVAEAAKHILANKDEYSPEKVKQAVFAENFGGKKNGGYVIGNEYDLSEHEIKELIKNGYGVERI